jgi:hypothetical protein
MEVIMFFLLPALVVGGAAVLLGKSGVAAADAALGMAEGCIKHPPIALWGGNFQPTMEGRRAYNRLCRSAIAAGATEVVVVGTVTVVAKYLKSGGNPLDLQADAGARVLAGCFADQQSFYDLLTVVGEALSSGLRPI